ncbi:MAG: hypothetical protein K2M17_02920, partial [Bacilli bacterium]|nr:hypothetical protein [Bacilli bacterium]
GNVDKQGYIDNNFINIIIAHIDGGIICHINRYSYDVRFYGIGEDDGHWFIVDNLWTVVVNNINYWKMLLMSEISELHIDNFNHQKVIDIIWNSNLSPETYYCH